MLVKPMIITRDKMPVISEITVAGVTHFLGQHRDFRNHEHLQSFLDKETDVALSWTHLKNGEQLNIHTHPVKSMIIICSGSGFLLGDVEYELREGDVVIVPSGAKHGFRGNGPLGFHALSVQFEEKSLYAKEHQPVVKFQGDQSKYQNEFVQYNAKRTQLYLALPIFAAIKEGEFKDPVRMDRMLSFLKYWSIYFQKLIMLRFVTSSSNQYGEIAKQHLIEEFGHDSLIKNAPIDDPIIKSISTWFVHQMLCRSDLEKHIIIHSVLENAAHCFHDYCKKYLSGVSSSYFDIHVEHDESHSEMGLEMIIGNYAENKATIIYTLDEAWDMFELLFKRAYELILK